MWWGLGQPDQHVQRSCGRKEHARRKAQIACAQRGEDRQRLLSFLLRARRSYCVF